MRSTDKPAQPNLGMGIGTNGLSTYEAFDPRYGYPEDERPWKATPKRKALVTACLWAYCYPTEREPIEEKTQ